MGLRRKTLALTALTTLLTTANAADRTATRQSPQTSSAPTIQVYSRETFLDVVVTDAQGRPVHGLKQSDFTLLEDGKEMSPRSFIEHRSDDPLPLAPIDAKQTLPPNTFTNVTDAPSDRPINILLLDNLNTPSLTQLRVQRQMLAMVERMPPGTRMAVLSLGTRLSIVEGITTDPELVRAALTDKKVVPGAFPLQDYGQDLANEDDIKLPPEFVNPNDPNGNISNDVECEHLAYRGQTTATAMDAIARYLSGMPGRKNLIWFTGSIPTSDPGCGILPGAVTSATDLLARSHVAIFPIDGRSHDTVLLSKGPNPHVAWEHITMDYMAEQTGGRSTPGSDDLTATVLQDMDSGSNFYTFTYAPTNQHIDEHFHAIAVKVNQPSLHLVYRPGYYLSEPTRSLSGLKVKQATPVQAAMERGGLEPTQILFKVQAAPTSGFDAALSTGNTPNPKKMKPPYRHFAFSYDIEIKNIDFVLTDGKYRADFEFGANVYDDNGDVVNSVSKEVRPILTPAAYQSMLKTGAKAHQEIDVPAKGNYYLRVAVHDLTSDRIGAVEVPSASIKPEPIPAISLR
jgi:VWFA-related protein